MVKYRLGYDGTPGRMMWPNDLRYMSWAQLLATVRKMRQRCPSVYMQARREPDA